MNKKTFNLLIVEDEIISSHYLSRLLISIGYINIYEADGSDSALQIIKNIKIDLVFMDININGSKDGIQTAIMLNDNYFIPIIYTTAYKDSITIEEASGTNIFGYLIKPFEKSDIEASLGVAFSRLIHMQQTQPIPSSNSSRDLIDLGNSYIYDFESKTLYIKKRVINLTKKELMFLDILCTNINQNISYEVIKEFIWNTKDISNSTIRDVLYRLKKKVEKINIQSVSGFGYILKKTS